MKKRALLWILLFAWLLGGCQLPWQRGQAPASEQSVAPAGETAKGDLSGGSQGQAAPAASGALFQPQAGTPVATANFVEPNAGCNWMGIAGQIFYPDGTAAVGLVIEVSGSLANKPLLMLALTGSSPALGAGGFELKLADAPVASQGTLAIQLYDLKGVALSERIAFDTYGGEGACERNLVLVNFSALPSNERYEYILPQVYRNGAPR